MNSQFVAVKLFSLLMAAILSLGGPLWAADGASAPKKRPTVGLALGGGGTRGAAHVGVLKVLVQEGIPIDHIAGTSMGSVVGGLWAAGVPVESIESKFARRELMKHFMTVSLPVRMAAIPLFAVPHLFGWKPYDGFYFGNSFRKYLDASLPAGKKNIEELNIPFRAICTDLVKGELYILKSGSLARAMQASCAIPILRRPVPLDDGSLLCDGAVFENLPVDQARDMGADIVIAVDVDERITPVPRDNFRRIGAVSRRVEQIFLARDDEAQLAKADIVVHPNVDGIGLLSTKAKDTRAAIKAGEDAARAALPEIRAKLNAAGSL